LKGNDKMTEYTKGEWTAEKNRKRRGENDIDTYSIEAEGKTIAYVGTCGSIGNEVNARLIAAAPDLLAACEATKNILEDINFRHSNKKSFHNNRIAADSSTGIEILINAIAKAKPK